MPVDRRAEAPGARERPRDAGVRVAVRRSAEQIDVPRAVQLVAYRTAQEALTNVAKHANATKVEIEVSWTSKRFGLCIVDNGCGFDFAAVTAGNGLANLRHRAGVIGGELHITREPGKGTRIMLEACLS